MELDLLRATFLAILQGLTEFLPVSSSAHLILPKEIFGWEDQGVVFDVAVHVGSLIAVVLYFRRDILTLLTAWLRSLMGKGLDEDGKLAWFVIMATVPAGMAGLMFNDAIETYSRSMLLIAFTSIFFALLLYFADRATGERKPMREMGWKTALIIGFSQVLALVPGTSRSGITITAGLFCHLTRDAAARFSFLLSIPIIAASGLLEATQLQSASADPAIWGWLLYGIVISALVSFSVIHLFLKLIQRVGFLPFILYRIALGLLLLVLYFTV